MCCVGTVFDLELCWYAGTNYNSIDRRSGGGLLVEYIELNNKSDRRLNIKFLVKQSSLDGSWWHMDIYVRFWWWSIFFKNKRKSAWHVPRSRHYLSFSTNNNRGEYVSVMADNSLTIQELMPDKGNETDIVT